MYGWCATMAWGLPTIGASSSCATLKPRRSVPAMHLQPALYQHLSLNAHVPASYSTYAWRRMSLLHTTLMNECACQRRRCSIKGTTRDFFALLQVVRQASGVVFLGGHPTRFMAYAVEELLTWYPFVPVEKSMQVCRQPVSIALLLCLISTIPACFICCSACQS